MPDPKYDLTLLETPSTSGLSDESTKDATSNPSRSSWSSLLTPAAGKSTSTSVTPRVKSGSGTTPSFSSKGYRTPRSCQYSSTSRRTPFSTSISLRAEDTRVIVAIVEGRGLARGEIGISSMDLKGSTILLSQFSDGSNYYKVMTKLHGFHPIEILLPDTAYEQSTLYEAISAKYPVTELVRVQRKYFNETKGLQYVKQLCAVPYESVEMEVRSKYYCLAATAALLKYIEYIQNSVYAPSSLRFIFSGSEKTAMIDVTTAVNLELLENLRDPKSEGSLFGVLNYTKTAMGARLLRANILQPSCDAATIQQRHEAVSDLISNSDMFYSLQSVISHFLDIDHLLALCVQVVKQETIKSAESLISNIIYLKHTLELVEPLHNALEPATNQLMLAYRSKLQDPQFAALLDKVNSVIHEDTRYQKGAFNMRTQKCFAVRPNINGLLDVSRKVYSELIDNVSEMQQQLSEELQLPIKSAYNSTRGFHMQICCGAKETQISVDQLPKSFIKVSRSKNCISFTTMEMVNINERIKLSLNDIYLMTSIVVKDLLKDVRGFLGCLYQLTDCVAMLDMVVAFAHNCTLSDYVCPEFTDTMALKQSRHPILDKIGTEPPIPNNAYVSGDSNFVIITGPNMSGKSTYLRQIMLLQIMAQIGSFVPAEYASFRVANQMFSRVGSDDDIETNSSTFTVEMRETNYIIHNISENSLIIIDELGRGTSSEEGIGLCHSICEYLLSSKAFTFFVTHFMELTSLEDLYPNVANYCFEVHHSEASDVKRLQEKYTHVLLHGKTKQRHYGVRLMEKSNLPSIIVAQTEEIGQSLLDRSKDEIMNDTESDGKWNYYRIGAKVQQVVRNCQLNSDQCRQQLKALQASVCSGPL